MIKFTTLFGLLAFEIAIQLPRVLDAALAIAFFGSALIFFVKSFHDMRISVIEDAETTA